MIRIFLALFGILVAASQPAEDVHEAIEAHARTLRKRRPELTQTQLKDMAIENLYGGFPETKFSMPEYERPDYRRMTPMEIVGKTYAENRDLKNAELVPRITRRLVKGNHQVDAEWIVKQLSYFRRREKDARWEQYKQFTRL